MASKICKIVYFDEDSVTEIVDDVIMFRLLLEERLRKQQSY